jgi:hypothetical protein
VGSIQAVRGRGTWEHALGHSAADVDASHAYATVEDVVYQFWTEPKTLAEWKEGADDGTEDAQVRRYCTTMVSFMELHHLTLLAGVYTGQTCGTGIVRGRRGHYLQLPVWGPESQGGRCPDWKTRQSSGQHYQLIRKLLNRYGLPVKTEIAYQGTADGTRYEREITEWIVFAVTHRGSLPGTPCVVALVV